MARKIHRPGLRIALIIGSALIGLVFPFAFLVTFFFLWTIYEDICSPHIESVPPKPRFRGTAADPEWREYYEWQCESVAEEAFLKAMLDAHGMMPGDDALVGNGIRLDMQVVVDKYRLDFIANRTHIIEIDGAQWHSSPEAVERDRIRDEYMVAKGYKVLRIPAKVVLNTPMEGLRRVDEYLGRAKAESVPRVGVARVTFSEVLQMTPEQLAAPKMTSPRMIEQLETIREFEKAFAPTPAPAQGAQKDVALDKSASGLNFDEEVDGFMRELDARKAPAHKP